MHGLHAFAGIASRLPWTPRVRKPRGTSDLGPSLGWSGSLELRIAVKKSEIRKAQKLRYKIFFEEGNATADPKTALIRRDVCRFDKICDHLLVIDHMSRNRFGQIKPRVVGAYRLLRQDVAQANFGFYSAQEFDIGPLLARHPHSRFLELGRSCVLAEYRGKRTIEMLWRGIWAYVKHYRIDAMIGCASIEGTDVSSLANQLSFLHHFAYAEPEWQTTPLPHRYTEMNRFAKGDVDTKKALSALPPLIKGYMRVGAKFGNGAVVDRQFGVTDVFVIMPTSEIETRYITYFDDGGSLSADT
jgi:putative hemolysin